MKKKKGSDDWRTSGLLIIMFLLWILVFDYLCQLQPWPFTFNIFKCKRRSVSLNFCYFSHWCKALNFHFVHFGVVCKWRQCWWKNLIFHVVSMDLIWSRRQSLAQSWMKIDVIYKQLQKLCYIVSRETKKNFQNFSLTSVISTTSPVFKSIMSPYALPAMLHLLNVMMFCVKVPVLSEKMYWICPSSSFNVVVRALANVFVFLWNIFSSQLIWNDWANRMT